MNTSEVYKEANTLLQKLIKGDQLNAAEKTTAKAIQEKLEPSTQDVYFLLELDDVLMQFEDFVHGEEGNEITYLRHKLFGILY